MLRRSFLKILATLPIIPAFLNNKTAYAIPNISNKKYSNAFEELLEIVAQRKKNKKHCSILWLDNRSSLNNFVCNFKLSKFADKCYYYDRLSYADAWHHMMADGCLYDNCIIITSAKTAHMGAKHICEIIIEVQDDGSYKVVKNRHGRIG